MAISFVRVCLVYNVHLSCVGPMIICLMVTNLVLKNYLKIFKHWELYEEVGSLRNKKQQELLNNNIVEFK